MTKANEADHGTGSARSSKPVRDDLAARQQSVAQYVADMVLELRNMAKSAKLPSVMVPLEFAYYEAYSAANKVHVSPDEIERIRRLEHAVEEIDKAEDNRDPPLKHAV